LFRVGVGGLAVVVGLLMAVPAGAAGQSVKISSPTAGEPGYPTCKTPTHVTNKCSIGVKVKGATPGDPIAIVECNSNVATGDMNACSATAGSAPGDADIVPANAKGKVTVKDYPVLVSSKTALGDGFCAKGDTCYILAADVDTMAEISNPVPFTAG
jgi:hypothetical protein